jgi:hypothetical protein
MRQFRYHALTALLTSGHSTEHTTEHSRILGWFGALTRGHSRIAVFEVVLEDFNSRHLVLIGRRYDFDVAFCG